MSLHISRKQNSFWKMPYQHCSSHLVFKVLRRCDYIVFGMKYSELDPKEPDILGSEMAFNKDNCSSAIQKLLWRRGTHSRALRIFSLVCWNFCSSSANFARLQEQCPWWGGVHPTFWSRVSTAFNPEHGQNPPLLKLPAESPATPALAEEEETSPASPAQQGWRFLACWALTFRPCQRTMILHSVSVPCPTH